MLVTDRDLEADRWRITQVRERPDRFGGRTAVPLHEATAWTHEASLFRRLEPGQPCEFSRAQLLATLGGQEWAERPELADDHNRMLRWLTCHESLLVEVDLRGAFETVSIWWRMQHPKRGRPRASRASLVLRAHWMREHEGYDNRDVASALYPNPSQPEALRLASDAASKGRRYCEECGIKPRS